MHYILTLDGKESEGAYAVTGQDGSKILQIFEERDDAERFVGFGCHGIPSTHDRL